MRNLTPVVWIPEGICVENANGPTKNTWVTHPHTHNTRKVRLCRQIYAKMENLKRA